MKDLSAKNKHSVQTSTPPGNPDRRDFLKTAGAATAGAMVASTAATSRANDANEQLVGAFIGCGGIAHQHRNEIAKLKRCKIAAVCDIDDTRSKRFADFFEQRLGERPVETREYERVMEMDDVDFVVISTPDHWHAIPTIAACAAGKDVYVEKPCCHNIREGRAMVDAMEKFKRVVQVGTHTRSASQMQDAREFVQAGKLGQITKTRTFNRTNITPHGMGRVADSSPPPHVDYDRWLGPAPLRPFNRNRFHGRFRWFFDYAAGLLGDWNVHLQDIVMWTMGTPSPISVSAVGGKYAVQDDRDTPDTLEVLYEFPGTEMNPQYVQTYSMTFCHSEYDQNRGKGVGVEFFGTDGYLYANWDDGWLVKGDPKDRHRKELGQRIESFEKKGNRHSYGLHMANFLDCIRSREKPIATLDSHFNTAICSHLGNIAMKVGSRIYWDADQELCFHDREKTKPHDEANALLGREAREGYELPQV